MPVETNGNGKDLNKVIDKIRKLLALGTSPNENEAAAAVAKAQELLQSYDLTMESIDNLKADPRTSVRHGQAVVRATEGKPEGWKVDIFEAVADSGDCFTAYSWEHEITKSGRGRSVKKGNLIGFGHDVELAGYALAFLVAEIERLAQAYADVMWAEIDAYAKANGVPHHEAESILTARTGRHPLKAKLYFIRGAAEAVVTNLQEAAYYRKRAARDHAAAGDNPYAIVLDKRRTVEDFIYMEKYGKTKAEYDADYEARMAKYRAEWKDQPRREETPEEAAKRRREAERYWEAQRRKQAREEAKVDHRARRAGREAGATIEIHPGIKAGVKPKEVQ